jgi:hypothetical protein
VTRNGNKRVINLESAMTELPVDSPATSERVQVLSTSMHIRDLSIERPSIIAYLQNIAPEKLEIALVHALEVGVTEMQLRRGRFRQ